jgi:NAD(P)-dependent dehydrogenase (short-subunit alcohol dehydrogenase family)
MNTITNRDIDLFIRTFVTKRRESLLYPDLEKNRALLAGRISGKSAMVIGGAGTIGSYYIKALLKFRLTRLVVVDINENGLTELVRDLRSSTEYNIPPEFITYPMNFGDRVFEKMFRSMAPFDIVANFAAHKHVRSEKDIFSVEAMIENNVLRAQQLLELLHSILLNISFAFPRIKLPTQSTLWGQQETDGGAYYAYSGKIKITTARFANVAFLTAVCHRGFWRDCTEDSPGRARLASGAFLFHRRSRVSSA